MNFEEVKEVKIDESDRNALAALKHNRSWRRLKGIVENYIQQLTYNISVGTPVSKESRYEAMDKLAGFVYYWKKISDLIENDDHHKKDETES